MGGRESMNSRLRPWNEQEMNSKFSKVQVINTKVINRDQQEKKRLRVGVTEQQGEG
jgi:hypothetical protein